MHNGAHGRPIGLHGAQVGVASVIAAAAWEHLFAVLDPADRAARAALPRPDAIAARRSGVLAAFADLDPSGRVGEECWRDYSAKLTRWSAGRDTVLAAFAEWDRHRAAVDELLVDSATLATGLVAAGAAARFTDLDPRRRREDRPLGGRALPPHAQPLHRHRPARPARPVDPRRPGHRDGRGRGRDRPGGGGMPRATWSSAWTAPPPRRRPWSGTGRPGGRSRAAPRSPLSSARPGWGEQNAEDWWTATRERDPARRAVHRRPPDRGDRDHPPARDVRLRHRDGRPLRPAMLWLDTGPPRRSPGYGTPEVHRITGKPPNPTPAWYKLLLAGAATSRRRCAAASASSTCRPTSCTG